MYEAEINAVIHGKVNAHVEIDENKIYIVISDEGPGNCGFGAGNAGKVIQQLLTVFQRNGGFKSRHGASEWRKHADIDIDTEQNRELPYMHILIQIKRFNNQ